VGLIKLDFFQIRSSEELQPKHKRGGIRQLLFYSAKQYKCRVEVCLLKSFTAIPLLDYVKVWGYLQDLLQGSEELVLAGLLAAMTSLSVEHFKLLSMSCKNLTSGQRVKISDSEVESQYGR
jgi:hypothetical protein